MPKRLLLVYPLAACILTGVPTHAFPQQSPPVTPAPAEEEADREALRQLKTTYEQAIRDNQIELLAPHLHRDFHGVMVTGRPVNSMADLQTYWRDIRELIGAGGSYTTTLKPERSEFVGEVALARGTTDDVVVTGEGTEFRFNTMWHAVLVREGGGWKLRSVQGTMDPVTNPFVREFSRRMLVRVGIGAGVVGMLVGLGAGLLLRKRRTRAA